jgi:hypothetical protein
MLLLGNPKDVIVATKKHIYFASEEQYMHMEGMRLMEILAHEYTHFWQRKHDALFMVKRMLSFGVALALVFLSGLSGMFWLALLACVLVLPVYNPWIAYYEFDAYRMSVLTRVCLWNNKKDLPLLRHTLFMPTDASLREIVDTLFSSTYFMQWAPSFVRERYLKRLHQWRAECLEKYFYTRLAFENNNTYLDPTAVSTPVLEEPYVTVLNYFVAQREVAHE